MSLSKVLQELNAFSDAEVIVKEVLNVRKRMLGPDHPDTMDSVCNMASIQGALGNLEEAAKMNRENWDRRRRVLGPQHPQTVTSVGNLACSLNDMEQFEEAADISLQVLEAGHLTLMSKNNLAWNKYGLGQHEEAVELLRRAVMASDEAAGLGPRHPETLANTSQLATMLWQSGKHSEAFPLLCQVATAYMHTIGLGHPATNDSMSKLARALKESGELAEAAVIYSQIFEACLVFWGPTNNATLGFKSLLTNTLKDMGESAPAADVEQQLLMAGSRVRGLSC
ncbi:hypothetical protein WJX72_004395 [[Myrmecia] bisecta]|uniref:Kinesin light chain n=1 Tax=[Myrmecia] bisecta TaxID=41462 RepID=A0AAW1QR81_9CHLO